MRLLTDARPVLLAHASFAVVLADARLPALLALASSVLVLADARPAAFLTLARSGRVTSCLGRRELRVQISSLVPISLFLISLLSNLLEQSRGGTKKKIIHYSDPSKKN